MTMPCKNLLRRWLLLGLQVTEFEPAFYKTGHAVLQLVEALCYKPEGRGFDSRWCNFYFSLT
jgi:hypothetical protein